MIRFDSQITMAQASEMAAAAGMVLMPDWKGGAVLMTRARALELRELANVTDAQRRAACLSTADEPDRDGPIFGRPQAW